MRWEIFLIFGAVAWFLWPGKCEARGVQILLPEKLEAKASVVCNGVVESIEETGPRKIISTQPSHFTQVTMLAKLKVLHVFKGQVPGEIQFRYIFWILEDSGYIGCLAEPVHVHLIKGERCRFFLNPDEARDGYVGVLDGELSDDYSDVETLASGEHDDSPYLKKEDIIRIATNYVRLKKPNAKFAPEQTSVSGYYPNKVGGAEWEIAFWRYFDSTSSSMLVLIGGDGKVNAAKSRRDGSEF